MNPFSPPSSNDIPNPPFVRRASWIWSSEASHAAAGPGERSPSHYQVRLFRRAFEIAPGGGRASLVAHVSADSRYLFFCNGELVARGPAKGDVSHQFYETLDLTPLLRAGRNVLAALVLDMSRVAHRPEFLGPPCSVMTCTGGFLLEGETTRGAAPGAPMEKGERLDTGLPGWRVTVDRAHRFQNEGTTFEGYHGYFEHRVSRELRGDWNLPSFDDAADANWADATTLYRAERYENRRDPASPYGLVPRMIPLLDEKPVERFADVFAPGGGDAGAGWRALLAEDKPLVIPANSEARVIVDAGALTTAYPRLALANASGRGARIRLTYAEALRLPWGTPGAPMLGKQQPLANLASHFADESSGWTFDRRGAIKGWSDIWEPAGGAGASGGAAPSEIFEPLHWRAFRYIGMDIATGSEPLVLASFRHVFCAYPLRVAARFSCSDARLEKIWDVALRTARLCAHETFEDCPHYEQMQYAGDTMITSRIVMLTTGDYRPARQALHHFDWSRLPDGLTQSRYPSRLLQVIPSWSLHWITMIRDYAYCSGDIATARELLPGARAVLDWFRRHADADGLPAKLPFWNITDWCPWWPRGVAPGADSGATCIIAAQYIHALDEAADLLRLATSALPAPNPREQREAAELAAEAGALRARLNARFWSESEGLYFDRPGGPETSQYGNAWAIVCGAPDAAARARMTRRFPSDPKLAPGSFFWWHTGFTALDLAGAYDLMPSFLGPWHEMVEGGLSTFVEENSYWRSLCHAWSAHPALEFLTRVLGVAPAAPGFARVEVAPRLCKLARASGSVCTPRGAVDVAWEHDKAGARFTIEINAPARTPVTVRLPRGAGERRFEGGAFKETVALPASPSP